MPSSRPTSAPPPSRAQGTVWIVDDDESSRLAIESLVESLGYPTQVFAAPDEYLAARTARLRTEDGVLISDIRMPGMTGLELLDRLVALGAAPPTIFVSAFPSDELRLRVRASAAVALLDKPVDAMALKRELANIRF
ncbi:response regulator transcription factor [Paraburkholderia sp. EG286B]|uniref:response regulator transcription factor n=1 Tax=Paraburkholderia sp. EG286B TaxID=3237011 RepID=UPI0034D1C8A3